jgi:hypothetical protein
LKKTFLDRAPYVFAGASLLPVLAFYVYGIFIAGFLREQAVSSFLPQLLFDPFFWRSWLTQIQNVIGLAVLALAALGTLLHPPGRPRSLMLGMWVGYALFCLTFNYHIATHDYYHLQLIPIAALALGPAASLLTGRLLALNTGRFSRLVLGVILAIAFCLAVFEARPKPLPAYLERNMQAAGVIGELVEHSTNTLFLASDYGLSLEYYGVLSGLPWPLASDLEWERLAGREELTAERRFDAWFGSGEFTHFIVMDLAELDQQEDLQRFLERNYPLLAEGEGYLVYDLR